MIPHSTIMEVQKEVYFMPKNSGYPRSDMIFHMELGKTL